MLLEVFTDINTYFTLLSLKLICRYETDLLSRLPQMFNAMKFASILHHDTPALGWLQEDANSLCVVDSSITGLPGSMDELIRQDDECLARVSAARDKFEMRLLFTITTNVERKSRT